MLPLRSVENKTIYTISEMMGQVNSVLDKNYASIWLKGEVSNFNAYSSGHFYFTLKDDKAQISAVMFKGYNRNLKFQIENGQSLVIHGHLAIYQAQGRFQVIVNHAEPDGIGALQLAYEQLKEKLQAEGLFDAATKQQLPFLPQKIGVVTSQHGAAVQDILAITKRRFPNRDILIYPVKVQGEGSAQEITTAINYFAQKKNVDVIIVGRGGGSLEDLWSFNEEIVARAIFNCPIPIISAVGHETDFTIADFVADVRAPTPSAAAELCVPVKDELLATISDHRKSLISLITDYIQSRLKNIKLLTKTIPTPKAILEQYRLRLSENTERLVQAMKNYLLVNKHNVEKLNMTLSLLSPKNVLKRGYIMGKNADGTIITRKKMVKTGEKMTLEFYDGELETTIEQETR
ncbi:exodeoxyribonuclease VII large subunit [bacterium]|nr:exodeoxyribonuclease VII large subunit [bacterium]